MLSWVSFWIDIEAVPARITLGLLTILTMTTQASSISERLPRVSYVKAIDVWMAMCLVMVFGALIEYSTVNVLYRKDKARMKARQQANNRAPRSPAGGGGGGGVSEKLLMDSDFADHHESALHSRHSSKVSTPSGGLPQPQVRFARSSSHPNNSPINSSQLFHFCFFLIPLPLTAIRLYKHPERTRLLFY